MPEETADMGMVLPDARKLLLTEAGVTPLSLSILSNAFSNFIFLGLSIVSVVVVVVVEVVVVVTWKYPVSARHEGLRNASQ